MIIYFEGVDGSGKTTLKDAFAKRLEKLKDLKGINVEPDGERLINTNPTKAGRLSELDLLAKLREMADDTSTIYLCDRGPLSDIIYRTFDTHKPVISFETFWVFWYLNQFKFIVVGCDTEKSLELTLLRGDDNPIAKSRHSEIRYLYQQVLPMFNAYMYDLDKDGKHVQRVVNDVLAMTWRLLAKIKRENLAEPPIMQ